MQTKANHTCTQNHEGGPLSTHTHRVLYSLYGWHVWGYVVNQSTHARTLIKPEKNLLRARMKQLFSRIRKHKQRIKCDDCMPICTRMYKVHWLTGDDILSLSVYCSLHWLSPACQAHNSKFGFTLLVYVLCKLNERNLGDNTLNRSVYVSFSKSSEIRIPLHLSCIYNLSNYVKKVHCVKMSKHMNFIVFS